MWSDERTIFRNSAKIHRVSLESLLESTLGPAAIYIAPGLFHRGR